MVAGVVVTAWRKGSMVAKEGPAWVIDGWK